MTASVANQRAAQAALHSRLAQPIGWWGMAMFIVAEAVLFALLLASYFYLLTASTVWPPSGIEKPDLILPGIDTAILLSSSIPMFWATSAIRKGKIQQVSWALGLSFGLGFAFLIIQGYSLAQEPFTPRTNAYGSAFHSIESVHAAHLIVGMVLVSITLIRNGSGHFTPTRHLAVENTGMYWHFVDAVWIFVFLSLHVSPYVFAP